ncbi:tripartite tricarboxylate transporter substrate binding protein [Bordetella sp. BOR01]|uniref:Bug family tripartite tricarboxylate transporter substrate binding protein n=1 Tax=Bordetella sp. BOR01 TaxID=2854779 RepID=UPI001C48CEB6|nr:tripartite tricarboxylate transporter substrate binding protein [Bordetella sp. BOR01]MBV7482896.1 tripartite tricarboxylate transporter substrate binding protein [Bordetella sp. BOR01]
MAIHACKCNTAQPRNTARGAFMRAAAKVGAVLALSAVAASAAAAEFPQRSIQLILSFPPGGATDVLARELSQKLGDTLGQSVVVLNRPGAGGLIGMQAAARSDADGYTLYISSVMSNSIYEAVNGKQQVSLDGDFDAVGAIASAPHILVTPGKLGIKDYAGLVSFLKAEPGKHNYASMGAGTLSNLEGEIFKEQAGVDALQIPYKGSSQALPEVIEGSSAFMFDSVTSSLPHKEAGRINVLAVASAKRLPVMADVPTFKELGVQGLEAENLFALMAPKGTPKDRIEIVAQALAKAQDDEGFRKAVGAQGFQISEISGQALPQFILDQQAFWRDKVKALNINIGK